MATRKTVFGMAAAMVLTAGLGTGVSFVLAQGEGKKPAPEAQAVAAVSQGREAAKPTTAESPANSIARLNRKLEFIAQKFHSIDKAIRMHNQEIQNKSDEVPLNVLEQMLSKIESQFIDNELTSIGMTTDIRMAQKNDIEAAMAGKLTDKDKLQVYHNEVISRINEKKEVANLYRNYQDAMIDANKATKSFAPESALYKEAQKNLNSKKDAYESARDSLLQTVRNEYFSDMLASIQREIANDRQRRELMDLSRRSLFETRMVLISKINKAKNIERDKKLVEDEIEILREVRKQLLKEQIQTEMALVDLRN